MGTDTVNDDQYYGAYTDEPAITTPSGLIYSPAQSFRLVHSDGEWRYFAGDPADGKEPEQPKGDT